MKLKLNNLVYTTTSPVKIEQLKELGAIVLEGEEVIQENTVPEGANLENLKNADLMALLDEKGIEYDNKATKAELIELLK